MAKMRALVLERQHELALREIDLPLDVGPGMVRIALQTNTDERTPAAPLVSAYRSADKKQLVLVEEIRVTRRSRARSAPQETTLRREQVIAERLDPASGEWRPIDRA